MIKDQQFSEPSLTKTELNQLLGGWQGYSLGTWRVVYIVIIHRLDNQSSLARLTHFSDGLLSVNDEQQSL